MAEFTGFIVLKIGCQKSILICSCPKFEFTLTKPKRKSFMQKKLHVKFWTFDNKVADVSVDVPTPGNVGNMVSKISLIFKLFTESLQTCFCHLSLVEHLRR